VKAFQTSVSYLLGPKIEKTHKSPMNPTVKKRIDMQVAMRKTTAHSKETANLLKREDNSKDLLGKFDKDKSVCTRARQRVRQCLFFISPVPYNLNVGNSQRSQM